MILCHTLRSFQVHSSRYSVMVNHTLKIVLSLSSSTSSNRDNYGHSISQQEKDYNYFTLHVSVYEQRVGERNDFWIEARRGRWKAYIILKGFPSFDSSPLVFSSVTFLWFSVKLLSFLLMSFPFHFWNQESSIRVPVAGHVPNNMGKSDLPPLSTSSPFPSNPSLSAPFNAPFFMAWFCSIWNVLFLPIYCIGRIFSCCFKKEKLSSKNIFVWVYFHLFIFTPLPSLFLHRFPPFTFHTSLPLFSMQFQVTELSLIILTRKFICEFAAPGLAFADSNSTFSLWVPCVFGFNRFPTFSILSPSLLQSFTFNSFTIASF